MRHGEAISNCEFRIVDLRYEMWDVRFRIADCGLGIGEFFAES